MSKHQKLFLTIIIIILSIVIISVLANNIICKIIFNRDLDTIINAPCKTIEELEPSEVVKLKLTTSPDTAVTGESGTKYALSKTVFYKYFRSHYRSHITIERDKIKTLEKPDQLTFNVDDSKYILPLKNPAPIIFYNESQDYQLAEDNKSYLPVEKSATFEHLDNAIEENYIPEGQEITIIGQFKELKKDKKNNNKYILVFESNAKRDTMGIFSHKTKLISKNKFSLFIVSGLNDDDTIKMIEQSNKFNINLAFVLLFLFGIGTISAIVIMVKILKT